jgi:predicted HTH domain antitoxin
VSLFRMSSYAGLALHKLAAELADESPCSHHHMFIEE